MLRDRNITSQVNNGKTLACWDRVQTTTVESWLWGPYLSHGQGPESHWSARLSYFLLVFFSPSFEGDGGLRDRIRHQERDVNTTVRTR